MAAQSDPDFGLAAGQRLRAPWAASVAGILFAVLFTAALILLRTQPMINASDEELVRLFAAGEDFGAVVGGLYLAPLAGIMFLWFLAVIRDQIGEREDRFFATVFFGSGVMFVSILFAATAIAVSPVVEVRYLGFPAPTAAEMDQFQAMSYTMLFAFGTRAAGVFMLATATVGARSGVFPRWFVLTGYLIGLMLLVAVAFWDWIVLVLPVWVGIVSVFILIRERSRQRAPNAPADATA
jgi:hypothetical protein